MRLRSPKLEFPDGATIDQLLTEETPASTSCAGARVRAPSRSTSTSARPDGSSAGHDRYTVRSTAVSGVGLVLSVGAGLFLMVWWARHWRRTRRSPKLVATNDHPAAAAVAAGGAY